MRSFIILIINNFWVRNGLILLCLVVFEQIVWPYKYSFDTLIGILVSFLLYVWIVFHNKVLLEYLLLKERFLFYVLSLLGGIIYFVLILYSNNGKPYTFTNWLFGSVAAIMNTVIGSICYFTFKYFKEQENFARNKIYLFEMEQKYLKNQLSPHFLFNTLNNIYSYSITDNKKTPELILKLSELMRYLIQFNKNKQISLHEEIDFINNYIAFERERLEEHCEITFDCELENHNVMIEPLLFFPLIENAFKHGTNSISRTFVSINIKEKIGVLSVRIRNKKVLHTLPSTGSGIESVVKRLDLFYKNKYKLDVNEENNEYLVSLTISLM